MTKREPKDLELMWFFIALQSQKLLIAALYRPPNADNEILEYLDVSTFTKMTELGAQSVIFMGIQCPS